MSAPLHPTSDRAQLAVTASATLLKRFYFLQRELIHAVSGWFPSVASWEFKFLLPEILWEDALLAREFRQRVLELRFPERRIAIEEERPLLEFISRCCAAPNALAFTFALADVIKPFFAGLYREYQSRSDALDDGPTQRILRHGLADLDSQIARLQVCQKEALLVFPEDAALAKEWCAAIKETFAACSLETFFAVAPAEISVSERVLISTKPLSLARLSVRDPRFHRAAFAWPDRHTPGHPGSGRQLRARQAVHHVNEVWAAEMAAACLHDFGPTAPPEFIEEAARWCFDEIRHCRMGYERLNAWGFKDEEIPLDTFSYDAGADVDDLTRLGIIFYFEATYIHTKRERTELFAEMGDQLSSQDMDFDWADELIHTHYGKHWLEYFLKERGDSRSLAEIKAAAREAVATRLSQVTLEEKSVTDTIFQRVMAKMPSLPDELP